MLFQGCLCAYLSLSSLGVCGYSVCASSAFIKYMVDFVFVDLKKLLRQITFCDETSTNWKLLNDVPHPLPHHVLLPPQAWVCRMLWWQRWLELIQTSSYFQQTGQSQQAVCISVGKYEPVNKERGLAGNSCISLQTAPTLLLTLY